MNKNLINQKVDDAMHSIDNISKASPATFFFTRLEAMMLNEKNAWNKISSFFAKPVIALACICIVIMMNIAIIFSTNILPASASQTSNEVAVADEYSDVTTSLYELEK
ncbi:MAG: hypothetical protein ABIO76_07665 [Ginsengibacter sp.]